MKNKNIYFSIMVLTIFKLVIATVIYYSYNLKFGEYYIGWDELQWQDSSIYFYNNGLGLDAIKSSLGLDAAFNNAGWPYLLGIIHTIFGLSYWNAIWLKMGLFLVAGTSLYAILKKNGHSEKSALISVIFLGLYHPLMALDVSYMRDDVLVYLIIILLRLSMVKGLAKSIVAVPFFLFFSYILIASRPFAFLVFASLYFFYFKLFRIWQLIFVVPFIFGILYYGEDIVAYSIIFIQKYQFGIFNLLFLTLKYYFGPLPWQMIGVDSGYSPLWFTFTLTILLISLCYKNTYVQILDNWKIILALFITGGFPYIISNQTVDAVGPRQFAMVGPFLFIIIYSNAVAKIKF